MSLLGIAGELQFRTSKLFQTISKSMETEGRSVLLGFRRKLLRAVVVVSWLQAVGRLSLLSKKETLFLPAGVCKLW